MQEKLPVLEALTDSALRPRHWQEIDTALGRALPPNLTLAHVDEMSLHTHAHTLQQVAHTAQLQREMENRLKKLEEDWEVAAIPVQAYTRKDLYVLDDLSELESLLLASDLTLHLLLHSQHALHIKNETVRWKNIHTIIKETVAALRDFETEWLALDLVLSSCTAMEVFPLQAAVFSAASCFWSATLSRLKNEPRVLSQLRGGMLLEELLQERGQLEDLRACVSPLLGMRKQTCPRLFALPDQDVVELLTKGQDLEVCHKYLRRMFTGIGRLVRCEDGQIVALVSPQQETLHLAKPVIAHHGVEDWLGRVESGMRATLRRLILKHVEDDLDLPTSELPLQVLDVCKRIQWSREVNRVFDKASDTQAKPDLQRVFQGIINTLDALTDAVRQNQSGGRTVTPLNQARMSYLTATLLELRDTTQTLVQDNPTSSLSYSWLQHLRHVITGEGRGAGVQVSVGVGQLDYGYEYMGVSPATIPTPTTLKAHHGLITAAIHNRCGVAVGSVGGGKTETVKGVARAAGQHLAMLTCSDRTPAQSLQHVVCGGVQGGYWLLLEDADLLPPTLLSRLSQYAHNIYQAKVNALKRGVIDGQEMNLVDSFTLFMSVTSQDDATVTSPYPLLNHPITPHLTSVSVCPPTLNTLLEAMLIGRGFSLSQEYLQKARTCFVQLTNLLDVTPPTSLARLVQATARVSCDIRHVLQTKKKMKENEISKEDSPKTETSVENGEEDVPQDEEWERDAASASSSAVFLWTRHPGDSEARSDEDIVTQALYAVISPLLSEKEDLWRREFNKIFELEDADDHKGSPGTCDLEVAVKQVLLEWGYGDEDDSFLGGESKPAYEMPDGSDIIKATQEGQQMIAEDTANEKETEGVPKEEGNKETEEMLGKSIQSRFEDTLATSPQVLAEALNRLWEKKPKEGNDGPSGGVSWRVLQCGAFTRDHLLGHWDEERRMWEKGVLHHTLTESLQSPGERWLVLVGPFTQDVLKSVAHLCHASPTFKDEALNQVILGEDVRIIIEQCEEKNLISHVRVRCPVLKLPTEEMTASRAAGRAMKRLLKVLPHLQGQSELSEARALVAEGLVNLELPQTSLMRVAGCVCRMTEARVTPATPPGELLEVLQQVLDLLHTARHPHLHQDAREGAYTPARLGSRSPAPSDAFLDYANRVVATPELQSALTLLPQLLDVTCPILLYAKPGNGLTTFLDIFERHRAPATRVIRFRCTPLSTAQELFSCMIGDLLPSTAPASQSAPSSGSDGESPIHDCLDPTMSKRGSFENIRILAPGDEGFSLLILEDVHLQLDAGGVPGTIWEIFRHMVECGDVVCPSSGTRYRLQRVVPLLALSCHGLPDQYVPPRILRHCVVMGVPCISSRSCEHIVKVSLQDVLAELDEDNFQPDATRDVVIELYQGLGASSRPQTGSRPHTASRARASSRPQTASRSRPSSRPQTASRSRASSRPRTASRPQTASRPHTAEPPEEVADGPLSGPASDKGSAKDSFDLPDLDTNTSNGSRINTGRKSRSASHRNTIPNLHHLLQLTEALRKNARLLQMTLGQSASLIAFEARRIFSSVIESGEELSDRVFKIVKNKFEELEEGLVWWPGQTEEGKKMMIHAKDYNEFIKNIQYPDGLQQIMFTQAHFMALLKLVITMETFCSHAVVVGPPGVGKLSLVKLAAHYTRARLYHLDDYRDEASRVSAVRSAVEASGVGGRRTVILVRDHSVTPELLNILHSLAHTGWSETLMGRLRLRGLLEAIRLKGKELPRENKWMTYLEEDEVTSLRHRLVTNVKRHLHVCLVAHSRHVTDSWCERYPPLRSRWSWMRLDRWDSDTLRQVARRILIPYDVPPHILHQMQAALPSIHLMLAREKGVTVTVSDYVEACRVTVALLARRRTELRESLSLFKGGMDF
ncbi:uncharacterized protein LOC122249110 [Penaeus japonicus]|uniref:uncharacterized protein LOC122249110 n=1 Tax=Penaeus japonicus TaxID=27405 RepID=UPI001C70E9D6|nr:uncharacterized protein LOC122249110 [Penaeus japonicus]